jgi:hypothetical protein
MEILMTHHKQFKNESQDARRHVEQKEAHPEESRSKKIKPEEKIHKNKEKK